ncbi:MAG: hypothetical protein LBR97_09865 [Dysgonamonadaceae bacterium]|jgi:hypothetical protein|nr:hypothetical protein [Dysgonamonadaceae bacterium]
MKKYLYMSFAFVLAAAFLTSCDDDYIIGGETNPTNKVDMTTSEFLQSMEETKQVVTLFERAGMKDVINGNVTIISPSQWSINRYLRRKHNIDLRSDPNAPELTISDISDEELKENMGMYVIQGNYWSETIPAEGKLLKTLNGIDVFISHDETNTDPGTAWDGGGSPWWGYQYSRFLQTIPKIIHIHYKRGNNWEWTGEARAAFGDHYGDDPECDHVYRMYLSDVVTKTGVVHILYQGDYNYSDHFFYHSLFFFGKRTDDRL